MLRVREHYQTADTHRLHQHVVLSKEECGSGVLVKRFHVVFDPHEGTVVHAAAGLTLLDLGQIHGSCNRK